MDVALIVIVGVLFVGMIVMQFVSTKKNRKKQEEMLGQIVVGAEIMTIGGIMGKIVAMDDGKETITVATGSTEIVFTKKAIHSVVSSPVRMETTSIPVPAAEEKVEEKAEQQENNQDK